MRPTIEYITYYLNNSISGMKILVSNRNNTPVYLESPILYTGTEECKSNCIYICINDLKPTEKSIPKNCVIAYIGDLQYAPSVADYTLLTFPPHTNFSILFNAIQSCFESLRKWGEALKTCVENRGSVQEMLEISQPIFQNPLSMTDSNHCYLAYTPKDIYSTSVELSSENGILVARLPQTIMSDIKKDIKSNHDKRKPFYYSNVKYSANFIMVNVHCDNIYIGSLGVADCFRPLESFDFQLIEYLSEFISLSMREYNSYGNIHFMKIKTIFTQLLDKKSVAHSSLQTLLQVSDLINWNNTVLYCINAPFGKITSPHNYICHQLEALFPGALTFSYGGVVILLLCPSAIGLDETATSQCLSEYLEQNELIAGASNRIADFSQLHFYYFEAQRALEYEKTSQSESKRIFHFKDYAIDYILSCACSDISPKALCAEGVVALYEHDKTANISYCNTLYEYLICNMNASQASKNLFIQRNTFIPRLNRILEILNADLQNPNERLYIMLSLKMLLKK